MRPLENVKILDLSRVLAGPFCTMLLADLGAEVVKVEIPGTGDDSRAFGPFKNNKSMYFLSINRGKKSISINMKTEKGRKMILDLVKEFDVIVENFKPGTMEKLGLGYDVIKEVNPKIIYAASSGFGHTGPDSKKPAYDILVQAMGGVMSITGWPNTPPTRVGMSIGDITVAFYTAMGILAGLYQRTITGLGQKVDVAMLDCQMSILENAMLRYQADGVAPQPIGNRHPTITPFQAYKAKDDYFVIGVGNDSLFVKFCNAIERNDLLEDERFKTNGARTKNLKEINEILDSVFLTKNVSEWIEILDKAQVPASPINTMDKVVKHPQLIHRNMIVDVEDKTIGHVKIAGNPIKMTNLPDENFRKAAPEIGEHNEEILSKILKYSKEEISKLKEEGII